MAAWWLRRCEVGVSAWCHDEYLQVRKGVKYTEPVNLQDVAPVPDFKLVR